MPEFQDRRCRYLIYFKEMIEEHTERYDDYVSKCKTNIEEKNRLHEKCKNIIVVNLPIDDIWMIF